MVVVFFFGSLLPLPRPPVREETSQSCGRHGGNVAAQGGQSFQAHCGNFLGLLAPASSLSLCALCFFWDYVSPNELPSKSILVPGILKLLSLLSVLHCIHMLGQVAQVLKAQRIKGCCEI